MNPPETGRILQIPRDVIEAILMRLDARSLLNFAQTCKYAQSIAFTDEIWEPIYANRFSPTGFCARRLIAHGEQAYDHYIRTSEIQNNWIEKRFHMNLIPTPSEMLYLETFPDMPSIIFAAGKSEFFQFDITTGQRTEDAFPGLNDLSIHHFAMDAMYVSVATSEGVKVYQRKTRQYLFRVEELPTRANRVKLAAPHLVIGGWDGSVRIVNVNTNQIITSLSAHQNPVYAIDVSPTLLATGSSDKTIKLWEVNSWRSLHTLCGHTQTINSIQISPDSRHIYSGSKDGTIVAWDVESGVSSHIIHAREPVNSIHVLNRFQILSAGRDQVIRLWDLRDPSASLYSFTGHTDSINTIRVSGSRLISCGSDKQIFVWDFA